MAKKATKSEHDATHEDSQEWFRSSDDVRSTVIQGVNFPPKTVEYSVINGRGIFEGDIMIGNVEELDNSPLTTMTARGIGISADEVEHGIGITGQRYRWPKGVIPYVIHPDLPNKERVHDAIQHVSERTRLRFILRNSSNASNYPNYIEFFHGDGCWSYVGMRGGKQQVSLDTGCGFGAAVHEILHAAGLFHEQSREDRDRHVRINWENIPSDRRHNFNQHITDGDDIGPYDFNSIMHYGRFAFSSTGQPTIEPIGGEAIGQRGGMSDGDIAAIRALYPHLEPSRKWSGVQVRSSVNSNSRRIWFTHSWPHHWYVLWSVVPTSPINDGPAQINWKVRVKKQEEALLTYYIEVQNLSSNTVQIEVRYDVLGWSEQTF